MKLAPMYFALDQVIAYRRRSYFSIILFTCLAIAYDASLIAKKHLGYSDARNRSPISTLPATNYLILTIRLWITKTIILYRIYDYSG